MLGGEIRQINKTRETILRNLELVLLITFQKYFIKQVAIPQGTWVCSFVSLLFIFSSLSEYFVVAIKKNKQT